MRQLGGDEPAGVRPKIAAGQLDFRLPVAARIAAVCWRWSNKCKPACGRARNAGYGKHGSAWRWIRRIDQRVMIADAERRVIYVNPAQQKLLAGPNRYPQDLPQFSARNIIVGRVIDEFHRIRNTSATSWHNCVVRILQLHIGGRTFRLVMNPIVTSNGQTPVRWWSGWIVPPSWNAGRRTAVGRCDGTD